MIRCSNFKPILMFYIVAKITDYQYCFCGWYTRCRMFVVESWITSVLGSVNILLLWLWETTILGINIKRPTVLMWYICQIIADNFVDDCHVLEYMWFIRKKRVPDGGNVLLHRLSKTTIPRSSTATSGFDVLSMQNNHVNTFVAVYRVVGYICTWFVNKYVPDRTNVLLF